MTGAGGTGSELGQTEGLGAEVRVIELGYIGCLLLHEHEEKHEIKVEQLFITTFIHHVRYYITFPESQTPNSHCKHNLKLRFISAQSQQFINYFRLFTETRASGPGDVINIQRQAGVCVYVFLRR